MLRPYTIEEFREGYKAAKRNNNFVKYLYQGTYPLHNHFWFEIVYVVKDSCYHLFHGSKTKINSGDFFIIDRLDCHAFEEIPGQNCYTYHCFLYPECIDKSLEGVMYFSEILDHYLIKLNQSTLKHNPTNHIFHDDDGSILDVIKRLKYENDNTYDGYEKLMRFGWIEIIIKTIRKIISEDNKLTYSFQTNYIKNYIEEHYPEKISLKTLSNELNYSFSYLSSKFKKDTGYLFSDYLHKVRVEHSLSLLLYSDKNIVEISTEVGYKDVKFFNKVFKKHILMTPAAFRRINRKIFEKA